ncbi:MAG: hypothetical protein AVDCRST_MAG49-1956 [uncultured Thermomicrobiales bacterium]|uniref:Uncharacterized protein n=1 Tax=uncultured Thermomicrobiales bacterium TaxID=1645740 RepID=A0A6J4UN99_9BACT|nr:MAG: hypothetical protein AVDCRST_MAG49-1956 [uncultured Thermomicrobiales bacterium]
MHLNELVALITGPLPDPRPGDRYPTRPRVGGSGACVQEEGHTMRKLLVMFTLLLGMLALPLLASGLSASAEDPTPNEVAMAVCQAADESGELDELGLTFGECLIFLRGQFTENTNIFIAGICGAEVVQEQFETTNKGQCIKVVKSFFSQP